MILGAAGERVTSRYVMRTFQWSPEAINLLRQLHREGCSAVETGERLGAQFGGSLTRAAVCGKWQRLGLSRSSGNKFKSSGDTVGRKPKSHNAGASSFAQRKNPYKPKAPEIDDVEEPVRVTAPPADTIPIEQRKQIVDLSEGDCRWPYGTPGSDDFFFCGAPKPEGGPYCHVHACSAFQRAGRYALRADDGRRFNMSKKFIASGAAFTASMDREDAA